MDCTTICPGITGSEDVACVQKGAKVRDEDVLFCKNITEPYGRRLDWQGSPSIDAVATKSPVISIEMSDTEAE